MSIETLKAALHDAAADLPGDVEGVYESVVRVARRRRGRRRVAIAVPAFAVVLGLAVAFVGLVGSPDRHVVVAGSAPSSSTVATPSVLWRPPNERVGNALVVTLRLLGGGSVQLVLPGSVDPAAITSFDVGGSVTLTGAPNLARDVLVERGTIAYIYRGHQLLKTFRGVDGQPVLLYRDPKANNMNYLVFQIGDWVVSIWDYPPGDSRGAAMTDQQHELWATHLRGHETADGFLVLDPLPPLTQVRTTDGPDASLQFGANGINILFRACQPGELRGPHDARGFITHVYKESGTWVCDPHVPLIVSVFGATKWQQNIAANFELRHLTGPLPLHW
jgi:hypothetical protein